MATPVAHTRKRGNPNWGGPVSVATENAKKAEAEPDQPKSFSKEWVPLWVPQQETKIANC
jgi:hypothetical protein